MAPPQFAHQCKLQLIWTSALLHEPHSRSADSVARLNALQLAEAVVHGLPARFMEACELQPKIRPDLFQESLLDIS